jgi:hypothetical protein
MAVRHEPETAAKESEFEILNSGLQSCADSERFIRRGLINAQPEPDGCDVSLILDEGFQSRQSMLPWSETRSR